MKQNFRFILVFLFLAISMSFVSADYRIASVFNDYLYTSYNNGITWTQRDTTHNWGGVSISESGQYMFATRYDGNPKRSVDYGVNWSSMTTGATNPITICNSRNGEIVFTTGTSNKIYKSIDYGANWDIAYNTASNFFNIDCSENGQYITAVINNGYIVKSNDYGVNWTTFSTSKYWVSICLSNDGKYQLAVTNSGGNSQFYKSTDYGANFSEFTISGVTASRTCGISGDGNTWYMNKHNAKIYKSTDYGTNWSEITNILNSDTTYNGIKSSFDGQYINTVGYGPTTGKNQISSDSGLNWTQVDSNRDWQGLAISSRYTPPISMPTANNPAGTYPSGVTVTLSQDQNYSIYYTLDGNTPDNTKTLYTAPIVISATTTLKAIAYNNPNYSTVLTNLYEVRPYLTTFTFKDENTTSAIPTVIITDSNGSVYTSDGSGVWSIIYTGVKSFDISKTGYATRPFDFNFTADANYNFLLNPTGLDSSIGFIVKDSNDNLWTNKYLMFKTTDGNIINSILTSSSGTATANILANGDYDALLYDATGTLVDTYEKTTVTVNKPKNEVTLADISPYDITVGGLLGYSLTNQSASSVSFNIFAGTQGFYYFSVVDYNAVPADRKYLPRQYFTQVPMGTGYSEALTYQPYLLLETDAVVPKITVLDQLNKPIGDVDIFISRSINNVQTIVESGKTTSTGNMSFSAYPLEYYYINVIYNGVDKGTFRVQPRESTDNFIIVIDTSDDVVDTGEFIITADFSGTPKVVNIDDSNINADITITQSLNQATSYNLYLIQNNVTKASTSGAITGLTTNVSEVFDSSVVDSFNNNLNLKLVVNYPDGNQTFYYTITATKNAKGLMYFAPQIINDIGQPLGIILAILITGILLASLTFSGLNISPTAITILGVLILGVFMFLGWLDTGITVLGFDIARFFYVLMAIAMIYFMMRGEQYA